MFNVGDYVRCIDDSCSVHLTLNKIYIIDHITFMADGPRLHLRNEFWAWHAKHFELIAAQGPQDQGQRAFEKAAHTLLKAAQSACDDSKFFSLPDLKGGFVREQLDHSHLEVPECQCGQKGIEWAKHSDYCALYTK